ncbi:MAG: ATP-grasp domain-containing protein [Pseudomonadota bacterium]
MSGIEYMIVGITYDLRSDYLSQGYGEEETAEFDRPETIDAIEETLQDLGYDTDRIGNIRSLAERLVAGDKWDLVFNIAEGLRGFGREAQVPALLDAYDIGYVFSDPLVLSLTLHKGMTKRVVRDCGIPTPDFVVIDQKSQIHAVDLRYPLFAKPLAEGTGKGINSASKLNSKEELEGVCMRLLEDHKQPVLVETFLPGREFTVGVAGTGDKARTLGVMEILLNENAETEVYSYLNKEKYEELVTYRLVTDQAAQAAANTALAVWTCLGCRDAGRIDLRMDGRGTVNFIEVNPLAGLHPEHSDLPIICNLAGISYRQLIETIMDSALEREPQGHKEMIS